MAELTPPHHAAIEHLILTNKTLVSLLGTLAAIRPPSRLTLVESVVAGSISRVRAFPSRGVPAPDPSRDHLVVAKNQPIPPGDQETPPNRPIPPSHMPPRVGGSHQPRRRIEARLAALVLFSLPHLPRHQPPNYLILPLCRPHLPPDPHLDRDPPQPRAGTVSGTRPRTRRRGRARRSSSRWSALSQRWLP